MLWKKPKPQTDRRSEARKAFIDAVNVAADAAQKAKVDLRPLADYLDLVAEQFRMSWSMTHPIV
jgi:hypothetical protein